MPVTEDRAPTAIALDESRVPARPAPSRSAVSQFHVQIGAFSVEQNAKALQRRLADLGHPAFIDRDDLYRVRLGPFATRAEALQARTALEASGISAMIVKE